MFKVKRYALGYKETNTVELPLGYTVIDVQVDGRLLLLYALVNEEEDEMVKYIIKRYRVNEDIKNENIKDYKYLGIVRFTSSYVEYAVFGKEDK